MSITTTPTAVSRRLSRLALAVLALSASSAWAQSSVSIYGLVDLAIARQIGSTSTEQIDNAGSRLGFRGEQQHSGGAKTFFNLESRFSPVNGKVSDPFFQGGAWLGISDDWGKLTLGRQWSVAFLKTQYPSDTFGMTTLGGTNYGTVGCGGAGGCAGGFWMDKAITYEHGFGGLNFGIQTAVGKPGATAPGSARPFSVGASYSSGDLYLAYGHEAHNSASGIGGKAKWDHFTANYKFGAVALHTGYGTGKDNTGATRSNFIVGAVIPVGAGKLTGSVNRHKDAQTTPVSQVSLGYSYPIYKQTTLYTTVTNNSKAAKNKSGFDVGLLYTF
jgi:predicted porin